MNYLLFSLGLIVLHTPIYQVAGVIDYRFTEHLYSGENILFGFFRDMGDEKENKRVMKTGIPAQIVRGFLMSVVVYPILEPLSELSLTLRFAFLGGLMFV